MDIIEQYIFDNTLSKSKVLELVDEYTLYCYYISEAYGNDIAIELRKAMRSPIKFKDTTPSFSVFESNNRYYEYLWKDSALPDSGGIFKLIKLIYGLRTYEEVYSLINRDFELGIGTDEVKTQKIILQDAPEIKEKMCIRIKSIPFTKEAYDFYLQFTTREVLDNAKHLKQVGFIWFTASQQHPITPKSIMFAYEEWDIDEKKYKYQLYSPKEEKINKFRNDFSDGVVPGLNRLKYNSDTLIITKAGKDILTWEALGYESICGRSETTIIPERVLTYLKTKYKYIIVWLDPDSAGCFAAHKYRELGFRTVTNYRCMLNNSKDISDHYRDYGYDKTLELAKYIIGTK